MGSYPVGQRGPEELAGIQGQLARSRGRVHCKGQSWANSATGLLGRTQSSQRGSGTNQPGRWKARRKVASAALFPSKGFGRPAGTTAETRSSISTSPEFPEPTAAHSPLPGSCTHPLGDHWKAAALWHGVLLSSVPEAPACSVVRAAQPTQ